MANPNDDVLAFLRSTRFWSNVLAAIGTAMTQTTWEMRLSVFLMTLGGLFTATKTADRISDNVVKGKEIEAKSAEKIADKGTE